MPVNYTRNRSSSGHDKDSRGAGGRSRRGDAAPESALETMLEELLAGSEHEEPCRLDEDDGWQLFQSGELTGRLGIIEVDGERYLRFEVRVFELPSDRELILPLMRELLTWNSTQVSPWPFGLQEEFVILALTRPLENVRVKETLPALAFLVAKGEATAELLRRKYSGTSKKRVVPPPGLLETAAGAEADRAREGAATREASRPGRSQAPEPASPGIGLFAAYHKARTGADEEAPAAPAPEEPPEKPSSNIGLFAMFDRNRKPS